MQVVGGAVISAPPRIHSLHGRTAGSGGGPCQSKLAAPWRPAQKAGVFAFVDDMTGEEMSFYTWCTGVAHAALRWPAMTVGVYDVVCGFVPSLI